MSALDCIIPNEEKIHKPTRNTLNNIINKEIEKECIQHKRPENGWSVDVKVIKIYGGFFFTSENLHRNNRK